MPYEADYFTCHRPPEHPPVHLNIRLPLALLEPEPADAPTGPEPEAHACQGCGNCDGCGKCQHEEKQA